MHEGRWFKTALNFVLDLITRVIKMQFIARFCKRHMGLSIGFILDI